MAAPWTKRDRIALLATIVGSSMVFIDGTVVSLALPEIQRQFSIDAAGVAWIVEGYALVLGALMLLGGSLADRYGRRRIFLTGTIIFTGASVACAFSRSLDVMLAARVVQGIGGMLLAPASLAIVGAHFTGDARGRAIGAWSAFGALTSTIGPAIGGVIIDRAGWPGVFWINVPLAAIVIVATLSSIEESSDTQAPRHLDVPGATLVTAGLGLVTYALIDSQTSGAPLVRIIACAIAGMAALGGFLAVEARASNALVPAGIFGSRTFLTLNLATFALYGALGAAFYELPFVMIQAHGYSATDTAIAILPMALSLVVLAQSGTALARRFGTRLVLTIGPGIVAAGFVALAIFERSASYWTGFFPGLLLVGAGMGITVAPLTSGVIGAAPAEHVGIASGINNAVSRVASLLAVAALGALLAIVFQHRLDAALAQHPPAGAIRATIERERARIGAAQVSDPLGRSEVLGAFHDGFSAVAITCALLAVIAAALDATGVDNKALRDS